MFLLYIILPFQDHCTEMCPCQKYPESEQALNYSVHQMNSLFGNVYSGPVCYAAETAVVNYPTQNRKMAEVTMIIPKYTWMISFISLWISHMIVAIRKDAWNSYKSRPRTTLIITATRQLFARWRLHYRISVLWVLLFWSCLGLSRRSAQS